MLRPNLNFSVSEYFDSPHLYAQVYKRPCVQDVNCLVAEVARVKIGSTLLIVIFLAVCNTPAVASSGDPQLGTDHPWYSGELTCSTWERLFANQALIFERVKGKAPQ